MFKYTTRLKYLSLQEKIRAEILLQILILFVGAIVFLKKNPANNTPNEINICTMQRHLNLK